MDSLFNEVLDTIGKTHPPMDQPGPSQPPPSSSTTKNPIVAVGRKVKSVLNSHQRPSVRILREPSSLGEPRRVPVSTHVAGYRDQLKENVFSNRFADARNRAGASIRSLFSREEGVIDDESFEHEYDPDTVDLLDVVGMYDQTSLQVSKLTLCRPRGSYIINPYQCPKLTLRPFARENSQSPAYV
jgi:hypothetical protein